MEGKRSEYVTIPKPVVVISVVGFVLLMGFLLYPVFAKPRSGGGPSSLSNLKQLGTTLAIYESDYDDYLPPHFTFDSDKERDLFIAATQPYLKNLDILKCPKDKAPDKDLAYKPGMEGDPSVMSFVHCQSLKGLIPHYADGRRALLTSTLEEPANTAMIRDPIRGFGAVKTGDNDKTIQALWSPHRGSFQIIRFDTSVKTVQPLNINKDL